ncbi:MAG TPA: type II toxin-antitoxin system VapC family toxin [Terracidiphilus sp.]
MKEFILDASVALGWLVDDPASAYAGRIQRLMTGGGRPVVPVHWHLEVANAILTACRRKALRRDLAEILEDTTALLPFIETDGLPDDIGTLVSLGQREGLTAYDAAYIALAARRNLPLATQDAAMVAAARSLKIAIAR